MRRLASLVAGLVLLPLSIYATTQRFTDHEIPDFSIQTPYREEEIMAPYDGNVIRRERKEWPGEDESYPVAMVGDEYPATLKFYSITENGKTMNWGIYSVMCGSKEHILKAANLSKRLLSIYDMKGKRIRSAEESLPMIIKNLEWPMRIRCPART